MKFRRFNQRTLFLVDNNDKIIGSIRIDDNWQNHVLSQTIRYYDSPAGLDYVYDYHHEVFDDYEKAKEYLIEITVMNVLKDEI